MAKDAGDRLLRLEDHEGDATDYHYNERNELLRVDYDGHTVAYGYDKVGRLVSTSLPNGIHCQRNYDQRNRLGVARFRIFIYGISRPSCFSAGS